MTDTTTHEADRDAEVLKGVLAEPKADETKATPPRRTRRATAPAKATGPLRGTGKAPAKASTKTQTPATARRIAKAAAAGKAPATGKAPAKPKAETKATPPKAESNGSSARDGNQALAKELVDLVAANFKGRSKADQEKLANWLKVLPTGGRAHERYWPKGFARPTTSDWRAPEA